MNISFLNNVNLPKLQITSFRGNPPIQVEGKDNFCPENKAYNDAIASAKNKILEHMQDCQTEYGMTISKDGEILDECHGTETHCDPDFRKMSPDSTLIHGHPQKSLLSVGDLISFLTTENLGTVIALCEDGAYSKISKDPEKLKTSRSTDVKAGEIYQDYLKSMMDYFEIDSTDTEEEIKDMYKEYAQRTGMNEDTVGKMPLEEVKTYLKVFAHGYKMNPQKRFEENMDSIYEQINSDVNIRLGFENRFLSEQAQKYGIRYSASY